MIEIAQKFGIIVGSIVAVGTLWRYVIVGGWRFLRRLVKIHDTIETVLPLVLQEFLPNGGSSLRDRVDQLHTQQQDFQGYVHTRFHDLLNEIAGVRARLDVQEMKKEQ